MYAAYCSIFEHCGLDYLAVEAESGPIGGDASHEFMVLADNGEDTVLHCKDCGYAANQEKAEIGCRDLRAAGLCRSSRPSRAHARRGDDRASHEVPQMPGPADDQDADLRGRRQADRRALSAAITRPTRARSAARPGRPRWNWPTPR